jgi:hypothetical protein
MGSAIPTFLGIDIGTSSVLVDEQQHVIAEGGSPLAISQPNALWSEQDPHDRWDATNRAVGLIRSAEPEARPHPEALSATYRHRLIETLNRHPQFECCSRAALLLGRPTARVPKSGWTSQ